MNEKISIEAIIIVEGKNDIRAVKNAVDCEVITTSGLGFNDKIINLIKNAGKKNDIIVLTDSDYAGQKIRNKIDKILEGKCRHAFIPKEESAKKDDIGVENASPESIITGLKKARFKKKTTKDTFTMKDMIYYSLTGERDSASLRSFTGKELGIGYANSKKFLSRLNSFSVTKDELEQAIKKYYEE